MANQYNNTFTALKAWILLSLLLTIGGCTSLIAGRFAENLGNAIQSQNDPLVVKDGAPAYLLLLDSIVIDSPNNSEVLRTSATLYGTYASVFVTDPERAKQLASKAKNQSRTAICQKLAEICNTENGSLELFSNSLNSAKPKHISLLFTYGSSWAGWIKANSDDWNAVAQVPKVEAIMKRIIQLDEEYEWGRAHVYLGIINSQLPPALGGKPEIGQAHFEKAISISNGQDLIAKVEYARNYARLMFDQTLHDQLLNEVLSTESDIKSLTLSNTLAKQQAKELLDTSTEYFEE